jgi:hypothetical protein
MEESTRSGFAATGFCSGEEWEIRLEKRLFRKIRIRMERPDQNDLGCCFEGWFFGRGVISLPSGARLRWRPPFARTYDHVVEMETGARLLRLRPAFLRFFRTETRLEVFPEAEKMPELPQLALLAWFLRVHAERSGQRVF